MDISEVMAWAGFVMTSASHRGAWMCSVQLGQETSRFPLMFISILKGGRERENYRLYVMYQI